MITNLAQFRLFGIVRAQQARSTVRHRIDRHRNDHFVATAHRSRRPVLVCHWQKVPSTGALECAWQAVDLPIVNQPRRRRLIERSRSPANASDAEEAASLRAAA
jgi:hypothetical protein